MTEKFIPPPPSDAAANAGNDAWLVTRSNGRQEDWYAGLAAAYAIDQPRVCREEVEKFAETVKAKIVDALEGGFAFDTGDMWFALQDFVARYDRGSDGPAAGVASVPEPVETPANCNCWLGESGSIAVRGDCPIHGIKATASAIDPLPPRWYDRPETLAFLRDVALNVRRGTLGLDSAISAEYFLAATDPEAK